MNGKLSVLIACIFGSAATVAWFVGIKAPAIDANPDLSPVVIMKSGGDGPESEGQHRRPSGQRGFTSFMRPSEAVPSHADALRKNTPGKTAAGQASRPTSPSASRFPPNFSRRFHQKAIREISQPLIFTDPGSIVHDETERDSALLDAAKQLASDLAAPGHAPDSPEYLDHWNRTVDLSNQLLRQRHGGQIWMAHHIQSHHLRTESGEGNQ